MPKTKTFDPDEFLFDLFAMRVSEVQDLFREELESETPHIEKIEVMIESGLVDVNTKHKWGRTPLHWASRNNAIEVAKLLIERGADVGAKDSNGWTPLHWASRDNRIEIARLLIELGADVETKDVNGETPLHYASYSNSIETAKLLLDAGAELEAKDNDGDTPLHWETYWNHIEIAELLIDRGADPWAEDRYNRIPYDRAKKKLKPLLKEYMKKTFGNIKNIV